ncbi:DUF6056 family protein [Streptococcus uberis]|uniref:DUF6056 family protein n=1 Tax=Streptococcus uberis TaxID=1349 RepID=UPI0012B5D7A8|nr:DUF6056 family protein [Streptococcus uberis]MTB35409.1 hypothetical protein [Streptococcus uberis]
MKLSREKEYWSILGIFIVIMTIGQVVIPVMGDDAFFINQSFSVDWLVGRYQQWSSRIFIEAILILISKQLWLFRVFNAIIFVSLLDLLTESSFGRHIKGLFLVAIFFLFLPVTLFLSAGWLATSINYLWPITAGIFVIKQLDKTVTAKTLLGLSVLTLFATNQEQVCIAILLILLGKLLFLVVTKEKIHCAYYLVLVLTMMNVVLIALSPGNQSRQVQSIPTFFPEFAQFGLFDKINLGISNTSKVLLVQQNMLMLFFVTLLAVFVILYSKKWYHKCLSVIPLLVVPINIILITLTNNGYTIQAFSQYLLEKQSSPALSQVLQLIATLLTNDVSIILNVGFILIFFCILLCLWEMSQSLSLPYLFTVGLASHAMMGFSPSIFKSGDRTAFILYMAIIYVILSVLKRFYNQTEVTDRK